MPHVLIVPIAFDLEFKAANQIVAGPGTKRACDHAIAAAYDEMRKGNTPHFLTTATKAGDAYLRVRMGLVMQEYLLNHAPEVPAMFIEASEFTTIGEVRKVADYIGYAWADGAPMIFDRVIFTVKSWHAPRVRMIARFAFKRRGVTTPFEVKTHQLKVGLGTRLREAVAYVQNWFRLVRMA